MYLALALASTITGTKPSPGLLAVAGGAWGNQPSLEQSNPSSSYRPGPGSSSGFNPSPGSDALSGLALVSDPLGLGLPPGGLVLSRVQGSATSAGLAHVLLRMLDHSGGAVTRASTSSQTSQSNRTAPLQQRQRLLVWTAIENYVSVSAHPCPRLLLQVSGWMGASLVNVFYVPLQTSL